MYFNITTHTPFLHRTACFNTSFSTISVPDPLATSHKVGRYPSTVLIPEVTEICLFLNQCNTQCRNTTWDWLLVGRPGFDSGRSRKFSSLHNVQTSSWAHPAFHPIGTGVLSLGVKRLEREAGYSSTTKASGTSLNLMVTYLKPLIHSLVVYFI